MNSDLMQYNFYGFIYRHFFFNRAYAKLLPFLQNRKIGSVDGGFHPSLPSIRIFAFCVSPIQPTFNYQTHI